MRYFVDTNVLVYRRHAEAGPKQVRAATIVERLWRKGDGRTSVMNPFALASSDLP